MKYKAIIFDMDGTIIDTEHIWVQATHDLITKRGVDFHQGHKDTLEPKLRGLALTESCQIIKEMFSFEESVTELVKEKSSNAVSMYHKHVRFIEGFEGFYDQVKKLNLKSGIATNADDDTVKATNKKLNLEQFFGQHIYGISAVNNVCKPNPAIYLHVAQQLGIDPSECLAVEDSHHGITAAKQAGMFCIGINSSKNREFVKASDLIIDSYEELDLSTLLKK